MFRSVYVKQNSVTIPFTTSESWTILSPIEQSIKRKIEAVGTPLKDWDIKINRGILTGCNDAFIISSEKRNEILLNCKTDREYNSTAELIRPILRGKDIKRYSYHFADQWLIATFPSRHYDIENYPAVRDYLLTFDKRRLAQTGEKNIDGIKGNNARKRTNNQWFETQDSISYWDDFSKQKIVWSDLMRITKDASSEFPRFTLIEEEIMLTNTAYFIVGTDIEWLIDALNSKIAAYFFLQNVTMFDNGGLRMFRQFIEEFPVPAKCGELALSNIYGFTDKEKEYIVSFILNRITEIQNR